jgi:probable F420-dependent oxidoreductase
VTLSYVAARTSRVRLGASVFVLPFRPPVLMARALASIDQLSDGRLIVGVGSGHMAVEFAAIGVPFDRRGRLTDEYLDAMLSLWQSATAEFDGQAVQFAALSTEPLPLQRPYPPLYIGGSSAAAVRRSVRVGNAWHGGPAPLKSHLPVIAALQQACASHGRAPSDLRLTTRAALRFMDKPDDGVREPEEPIGTPDSVTAVLRRYEEAGFDEIAFDTFFPHPALNGATTATVLHTLTMFAAEVLPAFARVPAQPVPPDLAPR